MELRSAWILTKMETVVQCVTLVFVIISSSGVSECSGTGGGYFLFAPPFGGRPPQQDATFHRRSDSIISDGGGASPSSFTPSETLWVGSHKINWSPLPLFLKFTNPNVYRQENRRYAQSRKFEPTLPPNYPHPTSLPGPIKEFRPTIVPPPPPHPPPNRRQSKFSFGLPLFGFNPFASSPPPKLQQIANPAPVIESRASIHTEQKLETPTTPVTQPTTPLPLQRFASSAGIILVSPPQATLALSTPGPSIRPIIEKLKKMTQWSHSQDSTLVKKEGRPTPLPIIVGHPSIKPKIRLVKKKKSKSSKKGAKKHKHNIEAIIMSNDDEDDDDEVTSMSDERKHIIKNRKKNRRRTNKENNKNGKDDDIVNNFNRSSSIDDDLVIIHPGSNAAFLHEPLHVQQSALKKYELTRKEKKLGLFRNEKLFDTSAGGPEPFSFKFGPEDAKMNPYSHLF